MEGQSLLGVSKKKKKKKQDVFVKDLFGDIIEDEKMLDESEQDDENDDADSSFNMVNNLAQGYF